MTPDEPVSVPRARSVLSAAANLFAFIFLSAALAAGVIVVMLLFEENLGFFFALPFLLGMLAAAFGAVGWLFLRAAKRLGDTAARR